MTLQALGRSLPNARIRAAFGLPDGATWQDLSATCRKNLDRMGLIETKIFGWIHGTTAEYIQSKLDERNQGEDVRTIIGIPSSKQWQEVTKVASKSAFKVNEHVTLPEPWVAIANQMEVERKQEKHRSNRQFTGMINAYSGD